MRWRALFWRVKLYPAPDWQGAVKPVDLCFMIKKPILLGAHWWVLAITGLLFGLVAAFVDLKPVVDENFFFSTSDPAIRQSKKLEQNFPSRPEVILAVSSRDISSS